MNRFQKIFIDKLVLFSKEYGFVVTEGGYIEPIQDWVDGNRDFEYTIEEDSNGVKITGVEMKL